jgi:hypothetical protein
MPRTDTDVTRRRALNARLAIALRAALGKREPLPSNAGVELRLAHLESQLGEVRTRVNGLFFAVLGSLALEVVGKVSL